jgi:hypothetical protein
MATVNAIYVSTTHANAGFGNNEHTLILGK